MTTKGVGIVWKTNGEHNRIYVVFCDFRVPLVDHFRGQGHHTKQNKGVVFCYFSGMGSGRVLECFWGVFLMLFGTFW